MGIILWIVGVIIVFWAVILIINHYIDLESRGLTVSPGSLIWRTQYGVGLMDKIANYSNGFWKIFGVIGGIVCGIFMVLIFLNLATNTIEIIRAMITPPEVGVAPGVMPILPGITLPLRLIIPVIIGVATVLLVHEPAHGIMARLADLPVKATGLLLFLVIPGAFVEPDEDKLKKASISDRIQVYCAGSFANILLSLICLGLVLSLIVPIPGLYISGVYESTPAGENLTPGMRLMEIGFSEDDTFRIDSYQEFNEFMENTTPGDEVYVVTKEDIFVLTLTSHPEKGENRLLIMEDENRTVLFDDRPVENIGFLGVSTIPTSISRRQNFIEHIGPMIRFWETPDPMQLGAYVPASILAVNYEIRAPEFLVEILFWMFILNFGIGLINLLPLKPLDGGHIAEAAVEKASSKQVAKKVVSLLSLISLFIIAINLLAWIM